VINFKSASGTYFSSLLQIRIFPEEVTVEGIFILLSNDGGSCCLVWSKEGAGYSNSLSPLEKTPFPIVIGISSLELKLGLREHYLSLGSNPGDLNPLNSGLDFNPDCCA